MDSTAIIGTVAAIASVSSFTPQAWRIIRSRSTEGLSAGGYCLTVAAFALWLWFGVAKSEPAIMVPNAICLFLSAFILLMIILPNRKTETIAEALDPSE
ncbi:MAG: SemiSWEET family sugar transporter [Sandaracinobacteroides sp.]